MSNALAAAQNQFGSQGVFENAMRSVDGHPIHAPEDNPN